MIWNGNRIQSGKCRSRDYLSAAYVAYAHGQGVDYTHQKYADTPVGNFWLEIARLVIEGMTMEDEKASPVWPQGPIQ